MQYIYLTGSQSALLQSADVAVLLTAGRDPFDIGGQVDGIDPLRNRKYPSSVWPCAWMAKNYKGAFIHELGHILGARYDFHNHIKKHFPTGSSKRNGAKLGEGSSVTADWLCIRVSIQ